MRVRVIVKQVCLLSRNRVCVCVNKDTEALASGARRVVSALPIVGLLAVTVFRFVREQIMFQTQGAKQ
jgi:hypothetical protein